MHMFAHLQRRVLHYLLGVVWLAPLPPPPPVSKLSPVPGLPVWRRSGEGGGEEPNHSDGEKAWSSVNHSILSGTALLTSVPRTKISWECQRNHMHVLRINIIDVNFFFWLICHAIYVVRNCMKAVPIFLYLPCKGNTEEENNGYVVFTWNIPAGRRWWWMGGRRYSTDGVNGFSSTSDICFMTCMSTYMGVYNSYYL